MFFPIVKNEKEKKVILFYVIYALTVCCNVPMNYLHSLLYLYVVCNTGQLSASMGFLYEYVVCSNSADRRTQSSVCIFSSILQLCFVQSQTCLNKSFIALYSFQQLQYRVAGAGSTKSRNHKSRSHKSFSFQSQVVRAETFLTYAVQGSSQRSLNRAWRLGDTASDHSVHT